MIRGGESDRTSLCNLTYVFLAVDIEIKIYVRSLWRLDEGSENSSQVLLTVNKNVLAIFSLLPSSSLEDFCGNSYEKLDENYEKLYFSYGNVP